MTNLRRRRVTTPQHGWDHPWPNAFELARVFPADRWTLVGGLMVQAHTIAHGITLTSPTQDLDMLLHIEIVMGLAREAADILESVLKYERQFENSAAGPSLACRTM